jgi:hypothetical protein
LTVERRAFDTRRIASTSHRDAFAGWQSAVAQPVEVLVPDKIVLHRQQDLDQLAPERSSGIAKADRDDPIVEMDRVLLATLPQPDEWSSQGNWAGLLVIALVLVLMGVFVQNSKPRQDPGSGAATAIAAPNPDLGTLQVP